MSRRIKRTQSRSDRPADRRKGDRPKDVKTDHSSSERPKGDRAKGDRVKGDRARAPRVERASRSDEWTQRERPAGSRPGSKPPRFVAQRAEKRAHVEALAQKP